MIENITEIDMKLLGLFARDFSMTFTIRQMTRELDINYSHAFNRVNALVKMQILNSVKKGYANEISLNISNLDAIKLISFIEEYRKLGNLSLNKIIRDISAEDPFACIGLFGSRVSGKATKASDWDVFILTANKGEIERFISRYSYMKDIQIQVFEIEEFRDNLISQEETVVKHIVRNKQIIYNPHPFYNLIREWESIRHAPGE